MKKEEIVAKLYQSMVERAADKIKSGEEDFPAYPWLGKLAVSLVVGIGNKSDPFYNKVNEAIVAEYPSQVYAISSDQSNGRSDGRNRVRANLRLIEPRDLNDEVKIRASSPRTQTE